jgi:peptidoglycan/LPS O-acetylase OafA/YrhL
MVWLFHTAWLALTVAIVALAPLLPAEVGDPGKAMGRQGFTLFMLAMVVLVPAQVTHGSRWLAQRWPQLISVPHSAYWFAGERLAGSVAKLYRHLCGQALLILVLFAAIFYRALCAAQPHWWQPEPLHWALAMALWALMLGLAVWWLCRDFGPPPPAQHAGQADTLGRPAPGRTTRGPAPPRGPRAR